MKKLANLKGVKVLSRAGQKSINGGGLCGDTDYSGCLHLYGCVYLCPDEEPNE